MVGNEAQRFEGSRRDYGIDGLETSAVLLLLIKFQFLQVSAIQAKEWPESLLFNCCIFYFVFNPLIYIEKFRLLECSR